MNKINTMNNIERIRQKLTEYNIDAMLVTNPMSRLFATGFFSSAGALIVAKDNAWFIIDSRYSEAAATAITGALVVPQNKNERIGDRIGILVSENGIKTLGFEESKITYEVHRKLSSKLSTEHGTEMLPAQTLINKLREVKSRDELDCIIKAQRLSEKVFEEILPIISTDITELELTAEIIYRTIKNGAEKVSFDPIVVSGANSSRPHGTPSNEKIQKGFLTIDWGVCLDGWCSDTTRTLCIGNPTDEMVRIYETVLDAQLAGISAVRGGVKGVDVDAAARTVIEKADYGEYFGHGFGHSLGREVHETLSASPLSEDILPAGAVMSAEPGIYLTGRCGVRIEDTVYITEDGCENITNLPKALVVL